MEVSKIEELTTTANKLIEAGKERADWFEPDAEVILASSAKSIAEKALTEAHQAGIDEAVEVVKSLKVEEKHCELCDGYCEEWSCPWPDLRERNRTLDDTIKALQDNK